MTEQVKIKKRYKRIIILLWILFLIPIISVGTLFFMISNGSLGFMPSFEELENPRTNLATEIYTSDQQLLGKYFKENRSNVKYSDLSPYLINALVATEDARFFEHSGIDFKSLGRVIFKTILGGKTTSGGGSTITQQLSKMLFPRKKFQSKKDIIIRKLKEWVIAIKLEKRYTKEEIITLYYNKFDFLNLAVGIKSASKVYFNTTPDSLKIEQAAMLVGMAKNPALFNPLRRPDTTLHRRNVVLNQMYKYKYITKAEYDSLKQLPLEINFQKVDHKLGIAPYFREYLRRQLTAKKPDRKNYYDIAQFKTDSLKWLNDSFYGWCNKNKKTDGTTYNIYKDGLKIYTTINYKMQVYAEQAVKEHVLGDLQIEFFKEQKGRKKAPFAWNVSQKQIDVMMNASMKRSDRYKKLKKQGLNEDSIASIFKTQKFLMTVFSLHGEIDTLMTPMDSIRYYKFFLHAGFMSMNPHTGYVKAYVGGTNFKHFQFDHVTLGKRQVGSTFKPFLYTLAMQEGFSPCYKVPNVPVSFILPNGKTWTPKNSDRTKHDGKMVTLRWGLANSVNSISAWLMKQFNPYAVIEIARKMGVTSYIEPVPAICLGTPDISLYEMVGAFSTFANKGVHVTPIFVTRIEDKNGNILATFKPKSNEAMSEKTAYLMINLLEGVVLGGTSMRLRFKYHLTNDIGAKTGTTQNQSDGWFMGLTPNLVSGCWVGGEDRGIHFRGIRLGQGANMGLPIWALYMQKVYADSTLGYSKEDRFERPPGLKVELDCKKYDKIHHQDNVVNDNNYNFNN